MTVYMRRDYIKWYSPSLAPRHGTAGVRRSRLPGGGVPHLRRPVLRIRRPRHGERPGAQDRARRAAGDLRGFRRSGVLVQPLRPRRPTGSIGRMPSTPTWPCEVAPFVRDRTSWPQMGTTGCSFGGYHAINFALRHPDLVTYAVSMSGAFDIPQRFLDGYYDQNAYFHSPLDYLPNLERCRVAGADAQQLLCTGGGQPGSAVRSEREAGARPGRQGDSAPARCVGGLRARLALVASDGAEVFRVRWERHDENRRSVRNGRIVPAGAGGPHQCHGRGWRDGGASQNRRRPHGRALPLRGDHRPHLARYPVLPLLSEERRADAARR